MDDYIAARAPFARPILEWLRDQLHAACPEATETIKWSMPFFDYKGRPLANMAAFKAHAAFGFWRNGAAVDANAGSGHAMGQFGRLTSMDDLPSPEAFAALVRKAVALADAGVLVRPAKTARLGTPAPTELIAAVTSDAAAKATWDSFPPGGRREYAEWIEGAKRPETRAKRVATALAQLADGKRLNWKYETR